MRNLIKQELIKLNIPKYDCSKGTNIETLKRHDQGFNLALTKKLVTHSSNKTKKKRERKNRKTTPRSSLEILLLEIVPQIVRLFGGPFIGFRKTLEALEILGNLVV